MPELVAELKGKIEKEFRKFSRTVYVCFLKTLFKKEGFIYLKVIMSKKNKKFITR